MKSVMWQSLTWQSCQSARLHKSVMRHIVWNVLREGVFKRVPVKESHAFEAKVLEGKRVKAWTAYNRRIRPVLRKSTLHRLTRNFCWKISSCTASLIGSDKSSCVSRWSTTNVSERYDEFNFLTSICLRDSTLNTPEHVYAHMQV